MSFTVSLSRDADDNDDENSICRSRWQMIEGMLPIEISYTLDLPITRWYSVAILYLCILTCHVCFILYFLMFKSALNHIALHYVSLRPVMLR